MGVLFKQVSWPNCKERALGALRDGHAPHWVLPCLPAPPRLACSQYLSGDKIYTCSQCKTHCTDHGQLISKVPARIVSGAPAPRIGVAAAPANCIASMRFMTSPGFPL